MTRGRKPNTPPDEFKQALLQASVRLIEESGIESLSLREVARRAGVSHQTPYHYFADRGAVLAAIAAEGFTELGTRLRRAAWLDTPARALTEAGRAYVDFALERPAHFRLMFRPELVDLRDYPEALAVAQSSLAALETLVQACRKAKVLRGSQREAVSLVWSTAHGLAQLLLDGPLGLSFPTPEAKRRHALAVLKGLHRQSV